MRSRCTSVNLNPSSYLAICFNFVFVRPDGSKLKLPPVIFGQLGNDPKKKTLLIYGHLDGKIVSFGLDVKYFLTFKYVKFIFYLDYSSTCRQGGRMGHGAVRSDQILRRIEALRPRRHRWQRTGNAFFPWISVLLFSISYYCALLFIIILSIRSSLSSQVLGWLHVIEAYQKTGTDLPLNLKFCLEGMEESGSDGLDELLVRILSSFFSICMLLSSFSTRVSYRCHIFRWSARTTSSCLTSTTVASPTTTGWARKSPASPTASEVSATSVWR